jgi:phosphoglycolate phosphatase-like HAD superfamily hydrolase
LDQITAIVSKDDVRFTKPNPEGFSLFKEFQRSKDLFIMIGDSSADRDAAARAGVDFLECVLFEKYPEEE